MHSDSLKLHIRTLPENPGVYQFYDSNGTIIYVGKAKNLKKRVTSYFRKNLDSRKTQQLVRHIHTLKHIIVSSESDALILENNLIKEHQPRYNILLRDDKTFPWICIKNEPFPRVFTTRKIIKDGSEYFGPFTNYKTVRLFLGFIKELYPLRTCNYDLNKEKIEVGKYKVCLEYHIGNCLGGCIGEQKEDSYLEHIHQIRDLLRGNFKRAAEGFKSNMQIAAQKLQFEKAQKEKEKLELLKQYQAKSTVVSSSISEVDVGSIVSDETTAYINFLQVSYGSIVRFHSTEIKKKLDERDEDILQMAMVEMRQRFHSTSKEVFTPFPIVLENGVKVSVPKIGEKKHLVDLSTKNAKMMRLEQLKQLKITDPDRHTERIMRQMQKDLRLNIQPRHIECFDNSNIQGTHPVAACVVFRNGKPNKKEYRHYGIKTVEGANDFASMEEVVFRRYRRLLDENQTLPQLIIIDGGKGQLSAALKSLDDLGLRGTIAIIGIAKRLEEIYFPEDPIPLYLDKRSESLKIIQQLRNEAHRFSVRLHRNKRSNNAIQSNLESVSGIGEKSIIDLLKRFKSVKRIKAASLSELEAVIGVSKGKKIFDHLHPKS